MLSEYFDWLASFWVWDNVYYALLGGMLFGVYVFYKGNEASSWRDIVGWGTAVYLSFILLSNLHRFIDQDPNRWESLYTSAGRWFVFIFTIVLTAGILRWWWIIHHARWGNDGLIGTLYRKKDKNDNLP